jgi:hypothetical protein
MPQRFGKTSLDELQHRQGPWRFLWETMGLIANREYQGDVKPNESSEGGDAGISAGDRRALKG